MLRLLSLTLILVVVSCNRILKIDLDGRISTWKEGSEGVSDVFFGGADLQWLYVTIVDKVYRRPVKPVSS
jgi:hypothetical protein